MCHIDATRALMDIVMKRAFASYKLQPPVRTTSATDKSVRSLA